MKDENLLDWYKSLNENEGLKKTTVPVLDNDDGHVVSPDSVKISDGGIEPVAVIVKKEEDPVVEKDNNNSMVAFILTKNIQNLLMRLGELDSPYSEESIERQTLTDKLIEVYKTLGEKISNL